MWKPKYFQTMTVSTATISPVAVGEDIERVAAERLPDLRDQPVVAVEHEAPDQAGGDVGEDIGQEEDHAEGDGAEEPVGEQHRHRQRQRQLHRQRDRDDQQVVDEGAAEDLVAEQLPVVLKADRSARGAPRPFQL